MSARLEKLQELLTQDPSNALLGYGLAQELAGLGRYDEAVAQYERLIAVQPNYCAAYFHGARAMEMAARKQDALAMYQRGIEAAVRAGDDHARSEMTAAMEELAAGL